MNKDLATAVSNVSQFITGTTGMSMLVIAVVIAWMCVAFRFASPRHGFEATIAAALALSASWMVNTWL